MDEIQPKDNPPITMTEEIQSCLARLGRELETHIESGIRVGKELIYLKQITPHGKWSKLAEQTHGLKLRMCQNYIRIAETFGDQTRNVLRFSNLVLIELSRPSTPESARKAALKEDSLTAKQAKELSAAHKRIQELESPRKPDLENLIPDLMKKYKGASITIGTANRLSCLDEGQQQSFLSIIESKQFEENQNKKLSDEKLKVLEDLAKATRERDEVKLELEKVSTTDTASVLIEKEKELKQIKKEYDRQLIAQRQEAEKTASELHERRFKDQIEQAEKYREKAEKKAKEERERATAAWTRYQEHETEIKNLKNQLDVDNPTNVDNARLKHVEETGSGLFIVINEIKKDMESIGGGMDLSIERLEEIIKKASLEVIKLQETGNEIINV
ncbi:MAG: hypothetical protein U9N77_00470 [Thermodesulfobacteriota bacterium]|nr:hypothetical protein [Thermodesulfobacteriota bacterium]